MLYAILHALLRVVYFDRRVFVDACDVSCEPWEIAQEIRDEYAYSRRYSPGAGGYDVERAVRDAVADWRSRLPRRERALLALDNQLCGLNGYAMRRMRAPWFLGRSPAQLRAVLGPDDIPF